MAMEPQPDSPTPQRPGALRRASAGAFHVVSGLAYLVRRPALWPLALAPALLAAILAAAGLTLAILSFPRTALALAPGHGQWPGWLDFSMLLSLAMGLALGGMLLGLALAMLLTEPLLERLAWRVGDKPAPRGKGPHLERPWLHSLVSGLLLLVSALLVAALGAVPLIGPLLAGLLGTFALARRVADAPLIRRGIVLQSRRACQGRYRMEGLGLGLAAIVSLSIPLLVAPLAPALWVGAARLAQEIEAAEKGQEGPGTPGGGGPSPPNDER